MAGGSGRDFLGDPFQADSVDGGRLVLRPEVHDASLGNGAGIYGGIVGDWIFRDGFQP